MKIILFIFLYTFIIVIQFAWQFIARISRRQQDRVKFVISSDDSKYLLKNIISINNRTNQFDILIWNRNYFLLFQIVFIKFKIVYLDGKRTRIGESDFLFVTDAMRQYGLELNRVLGEFNARLKTLALA